MPKHGLPAASAPGRKAGGRCRSPSATSLAGSSARLLPGPSALRIDSLIAAYPVVHINDRTGARAYDLLKTYAKSHGLRTFDSLIAATALEGSLTLVTRNRKHFGMID